MSLPEDLKKASHVAFYLDLKKNLKRKIQMTCDFYR